MVDGTVVGWVVLVGEGRGQGDMYWDMCVILSCLNVSTCLFYILFLSRIYIFNFIFFSLTCFL